MKKIVLVQLVLIFIFVLVGCNTSGDSNIDSNIDSGIVVTESKWYEFGSNEAEKVFNDIEKGDVLSDSDFGTLTLKKITDDYVVISVTEGFVEKTGTGINMNADDLTKIQLKKGDDITIASKTFDAGITITISYK